MTEPAPFTQPAAVNSTLGKYSGYVYAILRIIAGLMFACHGLDHVFGTFSGKPGGSTFILVGGWIELVTGVLIAAGVLTRPAAFLASGTMAVAYFKMHFPGGPLPIINHGDPAVLYCFVFLYMFFRGGGPLSLDSMIWGNTAAPDAVGGPMRTGRDL